MKLTNSQVCSVVLSTALTYHYLYYYLQTVAYPAVKDQH